MVLRQGFCPAKFMYDVTARAEPHTRLRRLPSKESRGQSLRALLLFVKREVPAQHDHNLADHAVRRLRGLITSRPGVGEH